MLPSCCSVLVCDILDLARRNDPNGDLDRNELRLDLASY